MKRRARTSSLMAGIVAAFALPIVATAADNDDDWHVKGELYVWGTSVDTTQTDGQASEVEFDDILDSLEFGFLGAAAISKGRWQWYVDLISVQLEDSETVPLPVPGIPVPVDANVKVEVDQLVVNAGGGYTITGSGKNRVDLMFGARYIDLDTDVGIDLGVVPAIAVSDSNDLLDGFVGIEGYADLSDRWYMGYYADIGTGDSDYSWQALIELKYEFSRVDAGVGYRVMHWELDGDGLLDDFRLSGPYVGVLFSFK